MYGMLSERGHSVSGPALKIPLIAPQYFLNNIRTVTADGEMKLKFAAVFRHI
jgi:hypothetical protein